MGTVVGIIVFFAIMAFLVWAEGWPDHLGDLVFTAIVTAGIATCAGWLVGAAIPLAIGGFH